MSTRIAATFIFSLVVALSACERSKTTTGKEQGARDEKEIQQKVVAFGGAHNAITDWKVVLPDHEVTTAYSIQVEDALARPDKRPVVFQAYLEDVVRRNDRTFLEFSDLDSLYLTLEATPEIVQQVMKESPSNFLHEYAVVAEIRSAQRPTFQIAAETTGDGPEVQLQVPDRVHVMGRCTGLLSLEATKN